MAQNLKGRDTQVLVVASIYLGAVLGTLFEPQPNPKPGSRSFWGLNISAPNVPPQLWPFAVDPHAHETRVSCDWTRGTQVLLARYLNGCGSKIRTPNGTQDKWKHEVKPAAVW